jgi:hypothetical protein
MKWFWKFFKILNILLSNGFTNVDKFEIFLKIKLKVVILEFYDLISNFFLFQVNYYLNNPEHKLYQLDILLHHLF